MTIEERERRLAILGPGLLTAGCLVAGLAAAAVTLSHGGSNDGVTAPIKTLAEYR